MGSVGSAITDFAGSALGLGRGGNVSGQGAIDSLSQLASANAQTQIDNQTALQPQQTAFANQLAERAAGKTPSIAQAQMQQAQDRNLAQQIGAAKANRAVNPALAARQTAILGAQGNQQIAQASGIAKLQEDAQNQAMFGNYLNQQQQNTNSALGAGQKSAESLFSAQTGKRNSDINMVGNILNQGGGALASMLSDRTKKTDIKSASTKPEKLAQGGIAGNGEKFYNPEAGNLFGQWMKSNTSKSEGDSKGSGGFADILKSLAAQGAPGSSTLAGGPMDAIGGVEAAGPMMMVASHGGQVPGSEVVPGDSEKNDIVDAKLSAGEMVIPKTVVAKGSDAIASFADGLLNRNKSSKMSEGGEVTAGSFLDALKPYAYKYKKGTGEGDGVHMSVMAQDLEKAGPVGKSMIEETPQGKTVNYGKGFGAILAAQADLNQRLKQIETSYGPKKAKA